MILKHRDRELLRFEWLEPQGVRVLSVNEDELRFLPLEMKGQATKGFRIRRHPRYNLSARRIDAINDFLQMRISSILEYGAKSDDLITSSEESCTVNHTDADVECTVTSDSLAYQIKQNMRADPFITKVELSEILNVSTRWIARKIKDLQVAGEIKRVGADKNGHWLVLGA